MLPCLIFRFSVNIYMHTIHLLYANDWLVPYMLILVMEPIVFWDAVITITNVYYVFS